MLLGYGAVSFAYFGARLLAAPGRVLLGSGRTRRSSSGRSPGGRTRSRTGRTRSSRHAIYAPTASTSPGRRRVPALALAVHAGDAAVRPGRLLQRRGRAAAGARRVDGVPALPPPDRARLWASLVGGYLFGFSSYMLGQQLQGHLHVTGVFLVPLVALVLVRFLRGELDRRGLAWRLGALLGLQLWISTEVALTLTLALAAGLAARASGGCGPRAPGSARRSRRSRPATAIGAARRGAARSSTRCSGCPDRSFTAPESGTSTPSTSCPARR